MKHFLAFVALPIVSACVSVELPNVVSDSAKLAKETYRSVAGKKDGQDAQADAESVSNTYVGQESQTLTQVKDQCVDEAAAKLFRANGGEVPYVVTQNTVSTINNAIAATCKVKANKIGQQASAERK